MDEKHETLQKDLQVKILTGNTLYWKYVQNLQFDLQQAMYFIYLAE